MRSRSTSPHELRGSDPPDDDTARGIIEKLFFSDKRYDLGFVGRYKINKKLGLGIDSKNIVLTKEDIFSIRGEVNKIKISESLERYIIELVSATRRPKEYKLDNEAQYIQFGASPRASINLNLASKACAYLDGRDYVLPEDIKEVARDVMNHRIILNYEAEADNVKTTDIIKAILNRVPISK